MQWRVGSSEFDEQPLSPSVLRQEYACTEIANHLGRVGTVHYGWESLRESLSLIWGKDRLGFFRA